MTISREFLLARRSVIGLSILFFVFVLFVPSTLPFNELQIFPFRVLIDLACVVLFFSIFIVGWHGYEIHRKSRSIVLAVGFLCAAVFNFFSIISETSMPHFSATSNYQQSTVLFSLLWHALTALVLLFIAMESIVNDGMRLYVRWFLRAMLGAITVLALLTFSFFDQLPALSSPQTWTYQAKTAGEIALISLFAVASVLFYLQSRGKPQSDDTTEKCYLMVACAALAMSEFCFSDLHNHHIFLIVLGQIYQITAAICIYSSLVTLNLRAPFSQLALARQDLLKSRSRLTGIIQTATDGIITIDKSHRIILANPAAASLFGYEQEQMMGMPIDRFIPMRHRAGHSNHVDQFGKTGTTIRQMGVQSADFSVTGLKQNGEEFPIEASISSLTEGDERFFTVIFRDITDRKIAKQKMEQYHRELSELSQSLQTIREEERKHIARELHDDLGQLLAALRMDFTVLEKRIPDNPTAKPILESMDKLVLNAISTLRRIATDLRPRALDEGGLYFALQTLQKDFRQRHGIECDFIANEEELAFNDEISTMVYRVIQESLTNVVRHAQASKVAIHMSMHDNQLKFRITDNGRGITEQDYSKRQSFGLVGIRERVRGVQGELSIVSTPEAGTSIEVAIPLSPDSRPL